MAHQKKRLRELRNMKNPTNEQIQEIRDRLRGIVE
jgi:hypothetical protein